MRQHAMLSRRHTLGKGARGVLTCAALLVACVSQLAAADWPMHRNDPQRTGVSREAIQTPLKLAWTRKLGPMGVFGSPVVVDGVVYVGGRETGMKNPEGEGFIQPGALYALDARTGDVKWKLDSYRGQRLQWIWSAPAVVGDFIYMTNHDGHLYKINKKGEVIWRYRTGGTDASSPLVVDGLVIFGSAYPNKEIFAVEASTGKLKWKTTTNPESGAAGQSANVVHSSPALAGDLIVIGANNGLFFGIDRKSGEIRWRYDTKNLVYFYTPSVINGKAILASGHYNRTVAAVDARTGSLDAGGWRFEADLPPRLQAYISSAASDGKTVYIGMGQPEQVMYAIDMATGERKWRKPIGFAGVSDITSSPVITGDYLVVGAGAENWREDNKTGRLLVMRRSNGEIVQSLPLSANVVASPAISNGMVYIGCLDGTFYAFKAASYKETGTSPTRVAPVPKTRAAAQPAKAAPAKTPTAKPKAQARPRTPARTRASTRRQR